MKERTKKEALLEEERLIYKQLLYKYLSRVMEPLDDEVEIENYGVQWNSKNDTPELREKVRILMNAFNLGKQYQKEKDALDQNMFYYSMDLMRL